MTAPALPPVAQASAASAAMSSADGAPSGASAANAASAADAADAATAATSGWGLDPLLDALRSTSRGTWLAVAVAALLVFWTLGAYNRLVVLRNAVAEAWSQVAEALRRRQEAATQVLAALREPLAAEQGALEMLAQALAQGQAAADALGVSPLDHERATAWVAAEAGIGAAAARVTALIDMAAAGGALALPAPALATFRDSERRLPFVRQLYNDATAAYNEAIGQFPTSLLTRLFRFVPAGRL